MWSVLILFYSYVTNTTPDPATNPVGVGVTVGVGVAVGVSVMVGVSVLVSVGVIAGVSVGVLVRVGVGVGVLVGVTVKVNVGVGVGVVGYDITGFVYPRNVQPSLFFPVPAFFNQVSVGYLKPISDSLYPFAADLTAENANAFLLTAICVCPEPVIR
jgi:hypothetical protein